MNGITYFRKNSSYPGDVTKNCSLTGAEMDENFHTLEGRDIKSVTVDGNDIIITLLNGEQLAAINALDGRIRDVSASFDTTRGVLTLVVDGVEQRIGGFSTEYTSSGLVATDDTVKGNGRAHSPIGLAPTAKTGVYRPVDAFVDIANNQRLPKPEHITPGDRFLTRENESDYGNLYSYEGVSRIATALQEVNSPWRVPTKEDWDELLNAIEPCGEFKNHDSAACNKHLGHMAGAFLKSTTKWRETCACHHPHYCNEDAPIDFHAPEDNPTPCDEMYCGEIHYVDRHHPHHGHHHPHHGHHHPGHNHNAGLDKYGMNITPAGYADDGHNVNYFGERAWYWTSTPCSNGRSVYTKRFEHDHSSVYQDITPTTFGLSLRLVKDYDGENYSAKENILGQSYPTVLVPSVKRGSAIWTSINVALGNSVFTPALPNNGANLTLTTKFYINEWTGRCWVRNEVRDGESVVVKNPSHGTHAVEYRVVGSDLCDVATVTYNDVLASINPHLEDLDRRINVESATARENEHKLQNAIDNEVARSSEADSAHDTRLEQLEAASTLAAGRLDELDANVADLHTQVDGIAEDLADTKQALADESAARAQADAEIGERCAAIESQHGLDVEATAARIAAVEANLADEASAREASDQVLNERCDAISADVEAKAETLQANINAVDATVPVEEGSSYDQATGTLFLKSKGGTNDITVQLGFNFGTI